MKIISIVYDTEKSAYERFGKILDKYAIRHSNWNFKPSSGGKYASYRVDVTINDRQTFDQIYKEFGGVEGVKWVI